MLMFRGISSVALLRALFLIITVTLGSAQFRCFTTPSSTGELNCGTADGEFEAASIEECCLGPNGQFFEPRAGSEGCTACIVFGWFNGTDITLDERFETYELQAGFVKGGAVQTFITSLSLANFQIAIEERGAVSSINGDFFVQDTTHALFGANPSPFNVSVAVRVDGVALEPAEGFTLSLDPANPTATRILAGGLLGLFVIPEISVVIRDLEDATLQFTEVDYSNTEALNVIQPQLQLSTTIAVDLVVDIIPLNLTFARDSGQLPNSLDPIQTDPNFDPLTQTATSVADFSIMHVRVTFASERSTETIGFNMGITDDTIHEADQIFAIRVEVISPIQPFRVIPERTDGLTALGRIIDDDTIPIGFEQERYTVSEEPHAFTEPFSIPIIKGDNLQSELQFDVIGQFIDGTATRLTGVTGGDYHTTEARVVIPFWPIEQSIPLVIIVLQDRLPEPNEDFTIELTTSGAPRVVVGQDGGPFARTTVVIVDDDELTIGWERNLTIVNETQGSAEVCLRILDIDEFDDLTGFSVMLFIGTIRGTAADPGDYTELRTDSHFVFITDVIRRACIDIQINDDTLLEELEFFSVQVVTGQDGLSDNIRLAPDLTFVEILDNDLMMCPDPPLIVNGMRTFTGNSVGDTATYTCDPGFELIGDPTTTCTAAADGNSATYPAVPPPECRPIGAMIKVNDTVIGDPLFAVPLNVRDLESLNLNTDRISLCYEIHGEANQWFNFVTDECTSVNAHYIGIADGELNVIRQIAIRAVDAVSNCREILVNLENCSVELDGMAINGSRYSENEITIRRFTMVRRVRVTVPNCQEQSLVMWITCQTRTTKSPVSNDLITFDSLRFDVMRGLNFGHRDSHGIIGQFWNVPIQLSPFTGTRRDGEVDPDDYVVTVVRAGSPQRAFVGHLGRRTWDRSLVPCLYSGNKQAGPIYEVADPNDPVIEGNYRSYRVPSAFDETGYQFGRFEESQC